MSLFGILFIIAVLTAIPTFGLSFVALFFAKKWINSNEGRKVAAAAINALGSDSTVTIPFVSAAGAQSFFKTHGSAEQKFHRVGNPAVGYIGYVKIQGDKENVVMVNNSGAFTHVTSFVPPRQFGDDLLSLVAKKEFLDSIMAAMGEAEQAPADTRSNRTILTERGSTATENVPNPEDTSKLIRAAKSGDVESQHTLAKMYMSGKGVRKSNTKAFDWCLRAARQKKDGEPMFDVAEMYRLGNGTEKNFAEAHKWYEAANEFTFDGHPEAQARLGIMYRDGLGVSQNLEEAYELFCHAATYGSADAMFNAGMMELAGEGVPQNIESAMTWIWQANHGQSDHAQQFLKVLRRLYDDGNDVSEDLREAFEWHVRAAKHTHKEARRLLGYP